MLSNEVDDAVQECRNAEEKAKKAITDVSAPVTKIPNTTVYICGIGLVAIKLRLFADLTEIFCICRRP